TMNDRLPTKEYEAHFWADPSRDLLKVIDITNGLLRALNTSPLSFQLDDYYSKIISFCETFLSGSGGSLIPPHSEKIELYYTLPIFFMSSTATINKQSTTVNYTLKPIGEGSYAKVFKYYDQHYNRSFVIKRALNNLDKKELERFKQEFNYMNNFASPYIVEVYNFNDARNEYTMELMDFTLKEYMDKNNTKLSFSQRKNMGYQILKAFEYIHSKKLLHRDISPNNILIKVYEELLILKVSDFGLVKNPDLQVTSLNTEFKGWFNDPALAIEGFHTYSMVHETYALTRLLYYILTGKTNTSKIKNDSLKTFVQNGLNVQKEKRYQDVSSIRNSF
ncbi:protein kinase family protein, partial [Enterococcus faecium]